jgi:hypothetical protein
MVEAAALGRLGIGNDISSLATFLSTAKSRFYKAEELERVRLWISHIDLNIRRPLVAPIDESEHYQRHLHAPQTWRLRKIIELALEQFRTLTSREQLLARCILLRTGQWALDCRSQIPSAREFRAKLSHFANEMVEGASRLSRLSCANSRSAARTDSAKWFCCESAFAPDLESRCRPKTNSDISPLRWRACSLSSMADSRAQRNSGTFLDCGFQRRGWGVILHIRRSPSDRSDYLLRGCQGLLSIAVSRVQR